VREPLTWSVPEEGRFITIHFSERHWWASRPHDATDTKSKRAFAFLRTFIGMRLADPGAAKQAPVLTIQAN
jgi:hypothetical protein